MRICYFGTYEYDYPRNRVLIQALRATGLDVVECHLPLWEKSRHKFGSFLSPLSLLRLTFLVLRAYLRLTLRYLSIGPYDVVIVGYIGQLDLFLAWLLTRVPRQLLILNPMISLYETLIEDRQQLSSRSIRARFFRWLDRTACWLADAVILDTEENIQYFCTTFRLPRQKFFRIFIGADHGHFQPAPRTKTDGFLRVLFYGKLIPLHGVETILDAAHLLRSNRQIMFEVIGTGQLSEQVTAQAKRLGIENVHFTDWVDYEKLPERIAASDLCLGIFGKGSKAGRAIPNKVYQALAMGKPVLTRDSLAIRELFPDGKGVYLVPPGDSKVLAEAILRILHKPMEAKETAEQGYRVFTAKAGVNLLGRQFQEHVAFLKKSRTGKGI